MFFLKGTFKVSLKKGGQFLVLCLLSCALLFSSCSREQNQMNETFSVFQEYFEKANHKGYTHEAFSTKISFTSQWKAVSFHDIYEEEKKQKGQPAMAYKTGNFNYEYIPETHQANNPQELDFILRYYFYEYDEASYGDGEKAIRHYTYVSLYRVQDNLTFIAEESFYGQGNYPSAIVGGGGWESEKPDPEKITQWIERQIERELEKQG